MRIDFIFTGTFWGILLILFGISIFLRSFDIFIPFMRIIFGLIIIYVGIAILSGGSIFTIDHNNVIFNEIDIKVTDNINDEYNIIFGKGVIDLTDISAENVNKKIEINTIFGSGEILINSEIPVKLKVSSVFGRAAVPDGTVITFGDYNYFGGDNSDNIPVEIEANAIFANVDIRSVNK